MEKPEFYTSQGELPIDAKITDAFERSLKELFFVRNPAFKKGMAGTDAALAGFLAGEARTVSDIFVYYPWLHRAVRIPEQKAYFELRTARNKNIIYRDEQEKYKNIAVGIAGMSVGSAIALTSVGTGGANRMRIADFDEIEATNLNRLRAFTHSIGINKAEFFARAIYELNPWAELEVYDQGITHENLEKFMEGLDVFIDAMDSIELKVRARFIAKEKKIPVLMATDNGDNVIFDVERFDTDEGLPIFNGRVEITEAEMANMKTFQDWLSLAAKIVGAEAHTPRMLESILELGKSIAGIPQLGSSASLAGSAASYAVRKIACGDALPSGRYDISLDSQMTYDYTTPHEVATREAALKNFLEKFGK